MQLYPAIDIKEGRCVRLTQGSFKDVKIYDENPVEVAKKWVDQGATFLHLVDLDGALAGHPVNTKTVEMILKEVLLPVQIGGGIRSLQAIEQLLKIGVKRVIIGTKAVKNPEFIKQMIDTFGAEQIVVGIDAKDGRVAIEGWAAVSNTAAIDLCLHMKEVGVKHIVYTDIAKDGTLTGPNVLYTKQLTEQTGLDIIASGGVSCMDDLKHLKESHITGAIIGKALYENRIQLTEAIQLFQGATL